jgi:hypothetical protein
MKKLITILLLLFVFTTNAQTESKQVERVNGPMFPCSTPTRNTWFAMVPILEKSNKVVSKGYLVTQKWNIGECSKNDVLVFTFVGISGRDGKKIYISANNEKNCDALNEVTFQLTSIDISYLLTKPLKSVKYINGNDQTSFFYITTKKDKYYFMKNLKKMIL